MKLPWQGTTSEISSEDDSRYETPGGAQNKVNMSQEYLLNLLKLAVTGLSNGSEAAIARYSAPYDITYDWLAERLDAADNRDIDYNNKISYLPKNILSFGAKGDGIIDDSSYFNTACDQISVLGGQLVISYGTYRISQNITIPSNVTLSFVQGAKLSIDAGKIVTINGQVSAGKNLIFDGIGTVSLSATAFPEWWGAKGDGVTNDSPFIQKAVNASDVLHFSAASYVIGTEISIPQARSLQWIGQGFRNTIFRIANGITGFKYLRQSSSGGTNWSIRDVQFLQTSLGKTSVAVSFKGIPSYHDNWIRVTDCAIYGLFRGFDLAYCGQCHFVGNYAQGNSVVYFLNRDASFIWFDRCMNLDNNVFVYGDDPLADGISNGINIHNCSSVFALENDIRIVGWQCVYITGGGGFDLGGNATYQNAAIYLGKCMDVTIKGVWVASDKVNSPNRVGIDLSDTHSFQIEGCSIVNNKIGVRVNGVASYATMGNISNNKFDGNTDNEIVFLGNVTATKIIGNSFRSIVPRTGVSFEVYINTGGSDYNIVQFNTFNGSSYTIADGTYSIIGNNIFGVGK